ncbi:M48 family metalloprotease [Spartinivicinus poritis]|uniref:Putative beta-barrel assembly-enhancing protease n=1 Tax=Spartinivicinus poritis TaxID=2994640 RepID=A0ABT5UA50_9GAMM|nr:M48 family metalloprotease [Spartinivicinus sp. A2-2]MDE1462343.1 M48 family metalloprotease [Spartinivicinus sp. A2-2]
MSMRRLLILVYCFTFLFSHISTSYADNGLPSLGDSTSSVVSPEKEHLLGRAWLQNLRSQVKTISDPELKAYVENLIYRLVETSQVQDRRLEVVIVDSPELNAFAVPGGIIGINAGLFLYAETEQQFASVLAHELAHLSQRHFARSIEAAKRQRAPMLAATLASVVLLAAGGGDAGLAAIASTHAAALQNQLSYSRQHEQEADRIGIQNLVKAGMDPRSMAAMFEQMNRAQRFAGRKPPEFLLTHPVTESRIADTKSRAEQYPKRSVKDSLSYHLMRTKVELHYAQTPQLAAKRFNAKIKSGNSHLSFAYQYGLALAYNKAGDTQKATAALAPLLKQQSDNPHYVLLKSNIAITGQQYKQAQQQLAAALRYHVNDFALSYTQAEAFMGGKQYQSAEKVLRKLTKQRPTDPDIWYLLAETQGLAKNIAGLHQSRAEYFFLNGAIDKAIEHLEYALKLSQKSFATTAKLKQRIKDMQDYKNLNFKL